MATLLEGISEKYEDNETDYGFIVFVSNSPQCKKGMFPPIMSLCDRAIDQVGTNGVVLSKLNHVCELDLSENNFSKWSEVLRVLDIFPSLTFLNLAKNQLFDPLFISDEEQLKRRQLPLRKLVLNNNKVGWKSLQALTQAMPFLEEVHLSNNSLENPMEGQFRHQNIRTMFLSSNLIDNFDSVQKFLGSSCPNIETLNLAECPLSGVPKIVPNGATNVGLAKLIALNVNQTKISTWEEVDNFRTFPSLNELRIRNCPLTDEYTAHERRSLLVARLPNVQIFNGGDKVPANEREDAERAFIRYYMGEDEKPRRYNELVMVHGELDPLVNVNLKPDTHVKVTISMGEEQTREETISVYLTVREFKSQLSQWFQIPVQNMRLYYCDQDLVQMAGPEEMKFPNKALYTFNVTNGDSFIVDEKKPLSKIKISGSGKFESTSPKIYGTSPSFPSSSKLGVTMAAIDPKTFINNAGNSGKKAKKSHMSGPAATVARNLFGSSPTSKDESLDPQVETNNNVESRETKNHSAGT